MTVRNQVLSVRSLSYTGLSSFSDCLIPRCHTAFRSQKKRRTLIPLHIFLSTGKVFLIRPSEASINPHFDLRRTLTSEAGVGEGNRITLGFDQSGSQSVPPPDHHIRALFSGQKGSCLLAGWPSIPAMLVPHVRAGGGTLKL